MTQAMLITENLRKVHSEIKNAEEENESKNESLGSLKKDEVLKSIEERSLKNVPRRLVSKSDGMSEVGRYSGTTA